MEKKDNRGGARPGAGRPKGSGNKVTVQELIDTALAVTGKPFVVSLMEGYNETIINNDKKIRVMYEKMIMDKVLADRHQVENIESEDTVEAKRAAFTDALKILSGIKND